MFCPCEGIIQPPKQLEMVFLQLGIRNCNEKQFFYQYGISISSKVENFLAIVIYNGKILMGCCENSTRRSFMECDISFKVENFHGAIIKRTKEKGK